MDDNLNVVVLRVKGHGLVEEVGFLAIRVPADYRRGCVNNKRERKIQNTRWSGTESTHLFNAESKFATRSCSHCCLARPSRIFDLLIEYCFFESERSLYQLPGIAQKSLTIVRKDMARVWWSLRRKI